MPARQSGSPSQQCIRVISAFVDSIDSHKSSYGYSGPDDTIVAGKALFIMAGRGNRSKQELKQETTAVPACYVPVYLKKHNARKAVWFTKPTVHSSNFCIC